MNTGLLIYASQSSGRITFGDEKLTSVITNLTGFMNPTTIDQVPEWNPANWSPSFVSTIGTSLQYGLGTVLFNFHSKDNSLNVTLRNLDLKWIYTKGGQSNNPLP